MVGLSGDEGAHSPDVLPAGLEDLLLRALVQDHVEDQDEHPCREGKMVSLSFVKNVKRQ